MTQKPARTARQPADAATAFEDLRREISLQRTAIEGLTSAKDKLPDYSPTLRDMETRLGQLEKHVESINEHLERPTELVGDMGGHGRIDVWCVLDAHRRGGLDLK